MSTVPAWQRSLEPVLFAALPSSPSSTQTISFQHLDTSTPLLNLRSPPSSAYTVSAPAGSSAATALPPRKTTGFLPCRGSHDLSSLVVSLAGKDGRAGLNYWNALEKGNGTVSGKMIPMGRITVLEVSHTGAWLACGTQDGRVMMWDIGTGMLLSSFDAHYRAVTCLAFSATDDALVTGSEDAMASVWSTAAIIDGSADPLRPPEPYALLSDHTLAISYLVVTSLGVFPDVRVFTASLDGTVKIWSPLNRAKPLLATFQLPSPVHHVVVDPLERFFFASYPTPARPSTSLAPSTSKAANPPAATGSTVSRVDLFRFPPQSSSGGIPLVPTEAGFSYPPPTSSDPGFVSYSTPAPIRITALHFPSIELVTPGHPRTLLLGLSNGKVAHLSLPDLQPLKTTVLSLAAKSGGGSDDEDPIVVLKTCRRPLDLVTASSANTLPSLGGSNSKAAPTELPPTRPVGALGRAIGKSGASTTLAAEAARPVVAPPPGEEDNEYLRNLLQRSIVFRPTDRDDVSKRFAFPSTKDELDLELDDALNLYDGREEERDLDWALDPEMEFLGPDSGYETLSTLAPSTSGTATGAGGEDAESLRRQVEELKGQLGQAMNLNDAMWKGIVEGTFQVPGATLRPDEEAGGEGEAEVAVNGVDGAKGKGRKRARADH